MDTVTLTIDGRPVTVAKGRTVLQAAIEAGISVPYYCYHPGLGVDGSCRVCVVKIEKIPKLQTACSTPCADGMVVQTQDAEVVAARAGIFEFLLVNHPLDCPVCDKGGECPLQDFSYAFGPAESRMDFPRRVFDGEGVKADVDFGPTLMLNRNRCILCTRCARFMREVDGDAQIGIVDRGYGSEIATFREQGVHSLLSGNLMDVCPVGAITTRDYRFKSRPWDNPTVVDTVCTLCSKGCNTSVWLKAKPEWARASQVIRMTPRFNPDVNGYWMCDIGRFQYRWIEGDTRLRRPLVRRGDRLEPVAWHDVETRLRDRLQEARSDGQGSMRFLVSAHASIEELFVLRQLADGLTGGSGTSIVTMTWARTEKPQPSGTTFTVPAADAPNIAGARDLGYAVGQGNEGDPPLQDLQAAVRAGHVRAVYVVDPGPEGSSGDLAWLIEARGRGALPLLVVQGVVMTDLMQAADIVLPGAAFVEKDAVYTNADGRVQAASRAIAPPGEAREDWQILVGVASLLGIELRYQTSDDVRRAVAEAHRGSAYEAIHTVAFTRPLSARHWLEASNPSERWKWDFMYQDLPPIKGHNVQMEGSTSGSAPYIPLRPVEQYALMEENVTLLAAFGAGVLSFISPCVLPLIPGYLSFISGLSLDEMRGTAAGAGGGAIALANPSDTRRRILLSSVAFILGFTLVFIVIGATASAVGQLVSQKLPLLGRIAGVVIVLFGLHTMGVLRIEWLYQEKRVQSSRRPAGFLGAMLVGIAFAFGWTPCIGPILSGILFLAGSQDTVGQGVRLLTAYSLGLGVPFFATAVAINRFFGALARIRPHYHKVEVVSGVLLVIIGLLIFTDRFTVIAQWLTPYLPVY